MGASPRRPAAVQAAAEDVLAGGLDQLAADSAHKAEAVTFGEYNLKHLSKSPQVSCGRGCACACWSFILPDSANWATGGEGGLLFLVVFFSF